MQTVEDGEVDTKVPLRGLLPLQVGVRVLVLGVGVLPGAVGILGDTSDTNSGQRLVLTYTILVTCDTEACTQFQVVEPLLRTLHELLIADTPGQ